MLWQRKLLLAEEAAEHTAEALGNAAKVECAGEVSKRAQIETFGQLDTAAGDMLLDAVEHAGEIVALEALTGDVLDGTRRIREQLLDGFGGVADVLDNLVDDGLGIYDVLRVRGGTYAQTIPRDRLVR